MSASARLAAASLLLLAAFPTAAATTPAAAGFAPQSLWLSKTSLTEGDSVTIYTVVYDSSDQPIAGKIVFWVDGAPVGTEDVSLAAGDSQIRSVSWIATPGPHALSASLQDIKDSSGASMALLDTESAKVTVSVAALPPTPTETAVTNAAGTARSIASSTLPVVSSVLGAIASTTEAIREDGQAYFANQLAAASTSGQVLGTSTKKTVSATNTQSLWARAVQAFEHIALVIFSSQLWFYMLLAFVLFVVFIIIRAFFRRK